MHSAPIERASRAARTPLTRLRQRLELARRRSGPIAEYQAAIGDSEAMLDLFAALLRIAQIESGTRRAGFAPIDLSAVLADLAEAYGSELEAKGQIENALRHCPSGTHVHLDAMAGPGGVHASVSDDGPGVPAEFRQDLLRPFSRLERSHTTPGSGLGLSLASAIVVLHDARLTLEDEGPGLRCIVTFPPRTPS